MKIVSKLIIIHLLFLHCMSLKSQDSTKVEYSHWYISAGVSVPFDYGKVYTISPKAEIAFTSYKAKKLLDYSLEFSRKFQLKKLKQFSINAGIGIMNYRYVYYTNHIVYSYPPDWIFSYPMKTKRVAYQEILTYPFIDIYLSLNEKLSLILGVENIIGGLEYSKYDYWNGDKISLWRRPYFMFYGDFVFNTGLYYRLYKGFAVSFEIQSDEYFGFPESFNVFLKLSYNFNKK